MDAILALDVEMKRPINQFGTSRSLIEWETDMKMHPWHIHLAKMLIWHIQVPN